MSRYYLRAQFLDFVLGGLEMNKTVLVFLLATLVITGCEEEQVSGSFGGEDQPNVSEPTDDGDPNEVVEGHPGDSPGDDGFAESASGVNGPVTHIVPLQDGSVILIGRFSAFGTTPVPGIFQEYWLL